MTRARDVADTQDNVGGAVAPYVAGKNKIINGDFGVWQRGTSFNMNATSVFTADRWICYGYSGDIVSQQTFTPGTAPVAGYEGTYFIRLATSSNTSTRYFYSKLEDVRTFAGQTVTFSFWAKTTSGTAVLTSTIGNQNFGTGGSAFNGGTAQNNTISTSWTRYTQTASIASVTGKTIGAGSNLEAAFSTSNTSATIDIWGVQLEAGNVATPFTTASGSIGGELALCQRYYYRNASGSTYGLQGSGYAYQTDRAVFTIVFPVTMRIAPTSVEYSGLAIDQYGVTGYSFTSLSLTSSVKTPDTCIVETSGSTGLTQYRPYALMGSNNASSYLGFSAEL